MRTVWRGLAAVLGVLVLASCVRAPLETEADRTARSFFTAVSQADWNRVEAALAPNARVTAGRRQGFEQARLAIPGGGVQESRAVGWERTQQAGVKRLTTAHLYRYPGADLVVRTVLERTPPDNAYRVAGFYISRLPPGRIEANRFSLAGKSMRQYLFLASAILSPLVMVGVAALAAAAPGLRFKLLWMALCFVGVGAAVMNWRTGEGSFVAAQIGLINAGVSRATDISPWLIKFSAPVGAVLTLVRLGFHKAPAQPKTA